MRFSHALILSAATTSPSFPPAACPRGTPLTSPLAVLPDPVLRRVFRTRGAAPPQSVRRGAPARGARGAGTKCRVHCLAASQAQRHTPYKPCQCSQWLHIAPSASLSYNFMQDLPCVLIYLLPGLRILDGYFSQHPGFAKSILYGFGNLQGLG